MKRKISYIATLVMVLCLLVCIGISVSAAEVEEFVEGYFTYTVTDGEATIVDVEDGVEGEIEIPEFLGGYPVVYIGDSSFENEKNITSIIFSDSVKIIEEYAFNGCRNIKNIVWGSGIEFIGVRAFASCDSLLEVRIPSSVTTIYSSAFASCIDLENVYIPESVTTLYVKIFDNCKSLKGIWVDENNPNYSSDEYGVLFNKSGSKLCIYPIGRTNKQYTVPDTVEIINDYSFTNCAYIEKIVFGTNVKTIKDLSFENCKNLKEIVFLGEKIENIEIRAFKNCVSLEEINIPDSIVSIGNSVFEGCENVKSVKVGKSVETIGGSAFEDCVSLEEFHIPKNVVEFEQTAFSGCSRLRNITVDEKNGYFSAEQGVLFDKDKKTLMRYPINKTDIEYVIPESVENFYYRAFEDCKYIERVVFGKNIVSLGSCLFYNCESLKSVEFSEGVSTISSGSFENCINLTDVNIPVSVTKIESWAFGNCDSLKEVDLSKNIIEIDDSAFSSCDNLEGIFVDELNEYYTDENGVLYNKNKTVLIQYPAGKKDSACFVADNVEKIEEHAFDGNAYLENIFLNDNIQTIEYNSFCNCVKLKELHIPKNVKYLQSYSFDGCTSLGKITVDIDNVYYSDDNGVLFNKDKTQLIYYPDSHSGKEYHIPDTVTTIECEAFAESQYIENIYIPAGVDTVYQEAFARCERLCAIIVDENNKEYSSDENGILFSYNKDTIIQYPTMKTDSIYVFPDSVEESGPNVFEGNDHLKHIVMSPNMRYIEPCIFSGCETLETVTVPGRVVYMGMEAFMNCSSLHSVYYSGSENDWKMIDVERGNDEIKNVNMYFDFKWEYENGVLVLTGSDAILDLAYASYYPWSQYAKSTDKIILEGVTSVGSDAFENFENLKSVIISGKRVETQEGEKEFENIDVIIEEDSFSNCENLSVVVSYANIDVADNAITGNLRPVKYFIESNSSNTGNITFISFGFVPETILETYDDWEFRIDTFKTVVDGEVSFNQEEFNSFVSALYYGSYNNFVNIVFNKLITEDFSIYEYTSLYPLQGREINEVLDKKIFAIIEVVPGTGEYMSFTMEDFCDFLASEEYNGHDFKFAVLGEVETPDDNEADDDIQGDEEYQEQEPNIITKIFATFLEAIKKVISLIGRLFGK